MKRFKDMTEQEKREFAAENGRRAWGGLTDREREERRIKISKSASSRDATLRRLLTMARNNRLAVISQDTYTRLMADGHLTPSDQIFCDGQYLGKDILSGRA